MTRRFFKSGRGWKLHKCLEAFTNTFTLLCYRQSNPLIPFIDLFPHSHLIPTDKHEEWQPPLPHLVPDPQAFVIQGGAPRLAILEWTCSSPADWKSLAGGPSIPAQLEGPRQGERPAPASLKTVSHFLCLTPQGKRETSLGPPHQRKWFTFICWVRRAQLCSITHSQKLGSVSFDLISPCVYRNLQCYVLFLAVSG